MNDEELYTTEARASYDKVRRDIEDAAVASDELGELIKEMMIRVYGAEETLKYYRVGVSKEREAKMDASYNQFRSLILMRVYGELKQAYADAFAMEVQA